jgi:hypothetical protein
MGGMGGAGGPRGPHGGGRAGGDGDGGDSSTADSTSGASGTDSTSTDYIAAADTDGDGAVSDAEQAAYEKKVASSQDGSATQKDPMRELAHALHLLKAYAENSGSDASTADAGTSSTTSVSVEA